MSAQASCGLVGLATGFGGAAAGIGGGGAGRGAGLATGAGGFGFGCAITSGGITGGGGGKAAAGGGALLKAGAACGIGIIGLAGMGWAIGSAEPASDDPGLVPAMGAVGLDSTPPAAGMVWA